jgi:transposase
VRATTACNKLLAIPGANVAAVQFTPSGVVVGLRRRARRLRCPCGWSTRAVDDRSTRRWRHLDLGAARLYLEAEIRRLACRACGRVRTETVPWARPGARFTCDLEDVVAYLAQRTDKTTITRLLRCSWEAVAATVTRVVAEHLDDARLEDLYRIGIDEVSYRQGHRDLTVSPTMTTTAPSSGPARQVRRHLGALLRHPGRRAHRPAPGGLDGPAWRLRQGHQGPCPNAWVCADPFHITRAGQRRGGRGPPGRPEQHPPRRRGHPPGTAGPRPPGPRCPAGQTHPLGAAERPG